MAFAQHINSNTDKISVLLLKRVFIFMPPVKKFYVVLNLDRPLGRTAMLPADSGTGSSCAPVDEMLGVRVWMQGDG